MNTNPIIQLDFPDPDVIRVENVYYMISTTMHFFPGGQILKSYDLIHWEHAAYVFDTLDGTPAQKLEDGTNIYGKGMWAASLRYHRGTFYVVFVCNDTHKTYLYRSDCIEGPWTKSYIEGFYHDCSLLFDDDERIYLVHGNREIYLTELNSSMTGPKFGGINKLIVKDSDQTPLGYEGSHLYKINNRYYLFLIHSLEDRWFRTQACFVSDRIDGDYVGKDILIDDMGYCNQGIAQGGIVDTPDGDYYAVLFQDRGAVGRIPVLIPMEFEEGFVHLLDKDMRNPKTKNLNPGYIYAPLSSSDDFKEGGTSFGLKSVWQFNHEPNTELFSQNTNIGCLSIKTDRSVDSLPKAHNIVTQRLFWPTTHAEVTLDASNLNDGDYAGLCVLQGAYGFVGVHNENGKLFLEMHSNESMDVQMMSYTYQESVKEKIELKDSTVRLYFDADFDNMNDTVRFNLGPSHNMYFKLDHFSGNRVGLFIYSTKKAGGSATFTHFVLNNNIN